MITAVLIGAGDRGRNIYGAWALKHSNHLKFTAVAEPRQERRELFAQDHGIPPGNCFNDWEQLLSCGKVADVCFVATQDRYHTAPALKALKLGYHVLLEKPMAVTEEDCRRLVQASQTAGRQLRIAHVLRYTDFFSKIKELIADEQIGKIMHISHSENVSYWHFAHSYVRGNWRRVDQSSPLILAKACHDLDILYWLTESPAVQVSSFGSLSYYHRGNAPPGASARCLEGCSLLDSCLWSAPRLYLKAEPILQIGLRSRYGCKRFLANQALKRPQLINAFARLYPPLKTLTNWDQWPVSTITDEPSSMKKKVQALREGPYGRCIYHCDNDVCDHQVVNIEFANGVTAALTVHGFAPTEGRWVRIEGTRGTLFSKLTVEHQEIVIYDHRHVRRGVYLDGDLDLRGHAGGEDGLLLSFVASISENAVQAGGEALTSAEASLESHLIAFAAEQSRLESRTVRMDELASGLGTTQT